MPKGYVIFTEDIHDEAQLDAYAQVAIPTILQAGGQILVVDDAPEQIEGPGTVSGPSFSSSNPWRPRGTGTDRPSIKNTQGYATLPPTVTQRSSLGSRCRPADLEFH